MCPRFIIFNSIYCSPSDSKDLGNFGICSVHFSDFKNVIFCKNSSFSIMSGTPLFNHISSVFLRSPKPQVFGIATSGVVATVANTKSFWNVTIAKLPSHSVRFVKRFGEPFFGSPIQNSISILVGIRLPLPTIVRGTLLDLFPKRNLHSVNDKFLKYKIILFSQSMCRCFWDSKFSIGFSKGFTFLRRNYQFVKNARPSWIITAFEIMTHTYIIQQFESFVNNTINNWDGGVTMKKSLTICRGN